MVDTKILPSPIFPDLAAAPSAPIISSARESGTKISSLTFGRKSTVILRPTIGLGVPFLTAVATHFRDRDALHADPNEGFLYLVQLVRLDNRFNLFHMVSILDRLGRRNANSILRIAQKVQIRGHPDLLLRPRSRPASSFTAFTDLEHDESGAEGPRRADA